jgi:peptidoglycan/LPS O-acetylase OafA/YrhL
VTAPADSASPRRLDFLDALRGVAVALVLLQHVGELLFPAVRELSTSGIQLGQFGVTVFFLCSGFIIPASLERGGGSRRAALRAFWISRVFRLYPLYWLSLGLAAALAALGTYTPARPMTVGDWVANASMFQLVLGSPHALGLYWTLAFEMFFYLAVSALFTLGWHRRSALLALLCSAGCVAAAALSGPLLGGPAPLGLFCLTTMFTGAVLHRWHAGALSPLTAAGCAAAALGGGAVLLGTQATGPGATEIPGVAPLLAAWLAAYAVFGVGLALRHRTPPVWLRRLGVISFSVYLMQALVMAAVPTLGSPLLTAAVWVTATLLVSDVTFRWVERPAVRLGRTLARRAGSGRRLVPRPRVPAEAAPAADPVAA